MAKDLTTSRIDRQNILNNDLAVEMVLEAVDANCIPWNGKLYLTKELVTDFFSSDIRTINSYIKNFRNELKANGMEDLRGEKLNSFIQAYDATFETDISTSHPIRSMTVFDMRAFLNMAMLLSENDTAHVLRQLMLDTVIYLINRKTTDRTKYIEQRYSNYMFSEETENNYKRQFFEALKECVESDRFKYAHFTDLVYTSFFKDNAKIYKKVLDLKGADTNRETFYSKILDIIAEYEVGLAKAIREKSNELGRTLSQTEAEDLFHQFENMALWKPLLKRGRAQMASKGQNLRDSFHYQLPEYIEPLDNDEHQKFLATAEDELEKLMEENKDVLRRLKEWE